MFKNYNFDIISKEEAKACLKHAEHLQNIWDNSNTQNVFPKKYTELQEENKEINKKIDELNDQIKELFDKIIENDKESGRILCQFFDDKGDEFRAKYIEPGKIKLSKEEILMSLTNSSYYDNFIFRPARMTRNYL